MRHEPGVTGVSELTCLLFSQHGQDLVERRHMERLAPVYRYKVGEILVTLVFKFHVVGIVQRGNSIWLFPRESSNLENIFKLCRLTWIYI